MRVLCGTDFSPASIDAATIAALWSARTGGTLHLIHAVPRTSGLDDVRERLRLEAGRLMALGAQVPSLDLVAGAASEVLVEEAIARQADLIVVGARGEQGRGGHRAGTTADRVARDAPVPVLAVRESGRLEQWLRGQGELEVVVGYERGTSAEGALRWVADLTRLGGVHPMALHLVLPGPENRAVHAAGAGAGLTLSPKARAELTEELRAAVAPVFGDTPVSLVVREALGRKDVPLVLESQARRADILVIGSHQRKGFQRWWAGSVSSGVLHAAETSVTVVPSPDG